MFEQRGFEYGVYHLITESEGPLVDVVCNSLNLKHDDVFALLSFGAIYLSNQRLFENLNLPIGSYLRVHTRPRHFPVQEIDWPSRVIADHAQFVIINKPAGVPCHPTVDNYFENCLIACSKNLGFPVHLTHRLDVPTQGLLLFAKTKTFQSQFNSWLAQKEIQKIYQAKVEGHCQLHGEFVHWMEPSPRAPKNISAAKREGWQECRLKILSHTIADDDTWLDIELLTGRTHQIRAQMSTLGFPVNGDAMYGSRHPETELQLFAAKLQFPDPDDETKQICFELNTFRN